VNPSPLGRRALATVVVLLGVIVSLAALVPSPWLEAAAGRMGHSDDFSSERVARFRVVAGALGVAHLFGGTWLAWALRRLTLARSASESVPDHDNVSIKPTFASWLHQPGKAHVVTLACVMACAAGIRLWFINVPMDYDEAYSFLNYARRPLYQALSDYNSTNNHLLNTLGMHVAYRVFGQQDWALRLHVLAAGVVLVGATYAFARRVCGPDVALTAAAWAAVSDVLVNYSVNARGYILLAWATVELLHRFWRLTDAEKPRNRTDWVVAYMAAAAGIFALPMMVYPVAGCVLLSARAGWRRKDLFNHLLAVSVWLWLVALTAGWLYGPGLILRGVDPWRHPFVQPRQWTQWEHWVDWLHCIPVAWFLAARSWAEGPIAWWALWALGGVGGAALLWRDGRALWALLVVPTATMAIMAAQLISPPPRVFCFLAPVFAVFVGVGSLAVLGWCARALTSVLLRRAAGPTDPCLAIGLAVAIVAAGMWQTVRSPLPGGRAPTFLVQHATRDSLWIRPADHLWRLSVRDAVRRVEREAASDVRVLVGLPADLPFHYYVAGRGTPLCVGGHPQPGERVFLVIRPYDRPADALAHDTSLLVRDPRVLAADWRLVAALGHLSIYSARIAR